MPEHNCVTMMTAVVDHLENGTPLPEGAEGQLRSCLPCSQLLHRAQRLGAYLERPDVVGNEPADSERIASAAVSEVVRRRQRRVFWTACMVLLVSVVLGMYTATRIPLRHPTAVAFLVSFIVGGPMLLLMFSVRSASAGTVFKRLDRRQVSGVCRGLAEAFGAPVWILRTIFVALLFAKGIGLVIYLLFDFVLPIHPADRANLLRFRVSRWWKARFA